MPFSVNRIVVIISLAAACLAPAQMTFSVKTNSDFPTLGTDFGYRFGKVEPYVGISNYSYRVRATSSSSTSSSGEESETSAAASVFITSLGLRLAMRDEGVKPYAYANLYKLFTLLDIDGNTPDEDYEMGKLYSPFGFGAGFGAEYAVAKGFSVFGEYGFRALFPGLERNDDSGPVVENEEISIMLSALNGSAGIRFAF